MSRLATAQLDRHPWFSSELHQWVVLDFLPVLPIRMLRLS